MTKQIRSRAKRMLARVSGQHRFNCWDQNSQLWENRARVAVNLYSEYVDGLEKGGHIDIVDLGCGNKRLERVLYNKGSSPYRYRGFDLHPQSPDITPIDIQTEVPNLKADVIFVLGVLEYIQDVPSLVARLQGRADAIILSYNVYGSPEWPSLSRRKSLGWVNHYSAEELESVITTTGWDLVSTGSTDQGRTLLWLHTAHQ